MQRRELIKLIAVITGGAVVGADLFLEGCTHKADHFFTDDDVLFFDEVADTIIPATDTPGAKDAATGKFMARYAGDCCDEANRNILKSGIARLNEASGKKFGKDFRELAASQKQELLTAVDAQAKAHEKDKEAGGKELPMHYFTLMKQLTLLGFFTSEPGATKVLRYNPVPGKYEGCIDYTAGETSWA